MKLHTSSLPQPLPFLSFLLLHVSSPPPFPSSPPSSLSIFPSSPVSFSLHLFAYSQFPSPVFPCFLPLKAKDSVQQNIKVEVNEGKRAWPEEKTEDRRRRYDATAGTRSTLTQEFRGQARPTCGEVTRSQRSADRTEGKGHRHLARQTSQWSADWRSAALCVHRVELWLDASDTPAARHSWRVRELLNREHPRTSRQSSSVIVSHRHGEETVIKSYFRKKLYLLHRKTKRKKPAPSK